LSIFHHDGHVAPRHRNHLNIVHFIPLHLT
jgi:hypothetical protein